ncbi:phasin family protein [Thauera phenolivorans]|uniref:phasin family protein n=1 Tax=Thauera phenolivorans TaxID=1792543 RepID=UPI00083AC8DA|nr:phasin family protein [Thauera phenolivorans]
MTNFTAPEQFVASNQASIETLQTLATSAFANIERLTALNLNTARSVMEDSVASTRALLAVKDVKELAALQASLAQPVVEKAVAYARNVYEITSQSQEDASKLLDGQIAEINKNVATTLDKAAKSAPAGSDVAVTAMRSAVAAANSAYDSMTKAARQVTDLAEANVSAATDATVKAVSTASRKVA